MKKVASNTSTPAAKPAADCAYSKLISKIREKQVKSGFGVAQTTDSRSQSPVVDIPTSSAGSSFDGKISVSGSTAGGVISATLSTTADSLTITTSAPQSTPMSHSQSHIMSRVVANTQSTAITSPMIANTTSSSAVTSTPKLPLTSATTAHQKAFVGLVDYPSFNQTNEGEGTDHSDVDGEEYDDGGSRYGESNGTAAAVVASNGATARSSSKYSPDKKGTSAANGRENKIVEDIRWPNPSQQIIIDKIAAYVVKNGSKFEQAIKARGRQSVSTLTFMSIRLFLDIVLFDYALHSTYFIIEINP